MGIHYFFLWYRVDSSVHLIYHDPSDLGSLILIRIIPKECTLNALLEVTYLDIMRDWQDSSLQ